jgi:hypothetical protein
MGGRVAHPIMTEETAAIVDAAYSIRIVLTIYSPLANMITVMLVTHCLLQTRPNVSRRIPLVGRAHSQIMAMVYTAIVGAALWMPTAAVKRPAVTPQHA